MNHFGYRKGELHVENVAIARIAGSIGTPFYCYSTATLKRHYDVFETAFAAEKPLICYSVKANGNLAVIRTMAELGAGADVVSEGELRRALAAGVPAGRIVFSGVGKTAEELSFALEAGILQVNVESVPELEQLSRLAADRDSRMDVAVRVNPDVDAGTHHKISTGRKEDKFGVDIPDAPAIYDRAAALPGVDPVSVAVHIGSQLTSLDPFRQAFLRVAELVDTLRAQGHDIRRLDLGGGLGIPYHDEVPPSPEEYAAVVRETVGHLGCRLVFEPGRMMVGNAGVLVSRVVYVKQGHARRYVILDAAMNDLMRPTLYEAYHGIRRVREPAATDVLEPVEIVGPVCETGDTFAHGRPMPPLAAGDLVAIGSAGAYGAVMASTYNARRLLPEVMVDGAEYAVVRPRQSYDELMAGETLAPWQTGDAVKRHNVG